MDWYELLLEARKLGSNGFTSRDLAESAGLEGSERSSATRIASAWLGKFQRWGYVCTIGNTTGERRWLRLWQMTDWGMRYKPGPDHGKKTRTGKRRERLTPPQQRMAANPKKKRKKR